MTNVYENVGPIALLPGVRRFNFWTYMYAAFICIATLAGMNFLQIYLLEVNLQIPRGEQGALTGLLAFCTELVALVLIVPFGVWSDRHGRRPIVVGGLILCGIGYGLYPLVDTTTKLIVFRIIFAVGVAALSAVVATVGNDYTQEKSRGRLFGFSGVMNGLGVVFMSAGIAQIPAFLQNQGYTPVQAGHGMFFAAAVLCLVSAIVMRAGLKDGTPVRKTERPPAKEMLTSGLRATSNPRIVLSYLAAFAGRSDNAIKGLFVSAWVINVAPAEGVSVPDAMAYAGMLMAMMGGATMVWMPIFGFIIDKLNRVTGMALAMGLAALGYCSMGLITSPFDPTIWTRLAFILMAIGQGSAIVASITLVGQEADEAERGTIIATSGWFGALGILIASLIGGILFDVISPAAPFVMIGIFQAVVLLCAVFIRLRAPGKF